MLDLFWLFLAVFALSFFLANYVVARKRPKARLDLEHGTKIKLVTASGAYRCQVTRSDKSGLLVSAPLHKDAYVPLRVGDSALAQFATPRGLTTFRTTVLERDHAVHGLLLALPRSVRNTERRSFARVAPSEQACEVNGVPSTMVDVSEFGARVVTTCPIEPGDDILLRFGRSMGMVQGWALDSVLKTRNDGPAREARIRFQEPVVLP